MPLFDDPDSVFNQFVDGYWTVEENNGFRLGNSNDYDISLDASGFSSFSIHGATRVINRDDAGSAWTTEGTHVSPVGSVAARSGLGTLPAEFTLGDTTNCTPPSISGITGLSEVCTGSTAVTTGGSIVNYEEGASGLRGPVSFVHAVGEVAA